jgi:hypothetical protein
LITHISVIGVSSFEFAAADDETQDNFATPHAPCLKKHSQMPKAQLEKLLRFYFLDRTQNRSKKNHKELVEMVINALEKRQTSSLGKSSIGAV